MDSVSKYQTLSDSLRVPLKIRNWMLVYLFFGIITVNPSQLFGQSPEDVFGVWTTIDESTGEPRSQVEIYKVDGKAFGKIVKFIENPQKETTQRCTRCPDDDDRKGELVMGMDIIRDLELKKGKWEGGTVLDPEKGKLYKCKIWLEDGKLKIRGYVGFFYRTQEWIRAE